MQQLGGAQLPALTPRVERYPWLLGLAGAIIQANMEPTGLQPRGTCSNCSGESSAKFQFWLRESPT